MTNYDIYNLVKFVLRKDEKGYPEIIKNFSKLLQQSSLDHFKEKYREYQETQEINDSLTPFEVRQAVSGLTTTTTTITLPSDYAHFIGMYWTDSDSYDRAFDLVTDSEWDMRCSSTITIPSNNYPICKVVDSKLYAKPNFIPVSNVINGYLYNWYALDDVNGFAPTGWHVPTEAEFSTLAVYLGGLSVASGKMKETGLTYWNSPNTGADNTSGFYGRGSGYRNSIGTFLDIRNFLIMWTVPETGGSTAKTAELRYNSISVTLNSQTKKNGFSVRLVRDSASGWVDGEVLTDQDDNIYNTVQIGTQIWTVQNYACTKYINGSAITNVTNAGTWAGLSTGAYCAYNNNEDNV